MSLRRVSSSLSFSSATAEQSYKSRKKNLKVLIIRSSFEPEGPNWYFGKTNPYSADFLSYFLIELIDTSFIPNRLSNRMTISDPWIVKSDQFEDTKFVPLNRIQERAIEQLQQHSESISLPSRVSTLMKRTASYSQQLSSSCLILEENDGSSSDSNLIPVIVPRRNSNELRGFDLLVVNVPHKSSTNDDSPTSITEYSKNSDEDDGLWW